MPEEEMRSVKPKSISEFSHFSFPHQTLGYNYRSQNDAEYSEDPFEEDEDESFWYIFSISIDLLSKN